MNLSIGIVGLPNVGKSTLFSALTKRQVPRENYPFCTIEPNVGCVAVPDSRLEKLAELEHSQKIIYATINFIDIAGLVSGAHKGEGLGNQFLAHIRETEAIAQVVRVFEDEKVTHVSGKIDPFADVKTIETELQLADMATVSRKIENLKPKAKTGEEKIRQELEIYQRIFQVLNAGRNVREMQFSEAEQPVVGNLFLLTRKPVIYVLNLSETQLPEREKIKKNFAEKMQVALDSVVPVCAKIEAELSEIPIEETKDFLDTYGLKSSTLDEVIRSAFSILRLISFFTAGEKESRAWPIKFGTTAQKAAGEIHSDFEKKFVKAEVVSYEDFISAGGWSRAAEKGLVRSEGKEYVLKDGEVVFFKHG